MLTKETENIKLYALGGLGEIGKNMYVVEVGPDIFILDAGMMLPKEEMLGVDAVIPDISHLIGQKHRIKGIFITHGHEEHIGAIPNILQRLSIPVYGTKLSIEILKQKLLKTKVNRKVQFREINPKSILTFDKTRISFFRVTHTIPDAVGICIHTDQGAIVYTGDFKIDQTPVDNKPTDFAALANISKNGVLCLLTESIGAESQGFSTSESAIQSKIQYAIDEAAGRVIAVVSSSNLYRIQQIFDGALRNNRKIMISGKQKESIIESAIKLKYLKVNESLLVTPSQAEKLNDEQVIILVTGSHLEPINELTRLATNNHKYFSIKKDDTVMMMIKPVPGHERKISKTIDLIYRAKATVFYGQDRMHVSGHASQEELKLLLQFLKPKFVIPVHGEYSMQKAYEKLALQLGYEKENIFLLNNGDVVQFKNELASVNGKVNSGDVLVDGIGVGDVGNIVLRDRKLLSQDGILIVVVTLSREMGTIVSGPEIITRGFVYVRESEELIKSATEKVNDIVNSCLNENIKDWSTIKNNIRDSLNRVLYEETKRRPMIIPILMEI